MKRDLVLHWAESLRQDLRLALPSVIVIKSDLYGQCWLSVETAHLGIEIFDRTGYAQARQILAAPPLAGQRKPAIVVLDPGEQYTPAPGGE